MKKLILIVLGIAAIVSGCTSDEGEMLVEKQDDAPQMRVSRFRSVDEARNIAQQAIDALGSGARSTRTLKGNSGVTVVRTHASRSGDSDTIMYALDMEDDQGFVLIAAPSDMSPLIAVIENGSYSDPENLKNESYQFVLAQTEENIIRNISSTTIPITPQPSPYWEIDSLNYRLEPAVKVNWDPWWPANSYVTQNKVAGCGPVASAMIMSVFELPKNITYTFPGRDISSETLDWSSIKKHKISANLIEVISNPLIQHLGQCELSYEGHKTIGRLMRQIGEICHANYEAPSNEHLSGRTSVNTANRYNALTQYLTGIATKDGTTTWRLYLDLHYYKTAFVSAGDANNSDNAHIWVADGVWRVGMKKYYYEPAGYSEVLQPGEVLGEYKLVYTEGEIYDLLHYNWGYGGNCNGWFIRTEKNEPLDPYEHDQETGNYSFGSSPSEYSINVEYRCYGER